MPTRPPHPCPGEGHQRCGILVTTPRCPAHTHSLTTAERKRMARAVADWRQAHGDICPGFEREPHPATDLTADHVIPRLAGGSGGPLGILCRSCNSKRGAAGVTR